VVNAYQKAANAVRRKILLRIDFLLNEYTVTPRNKQAKLALKVNQANTFIEFYPCLNPIASSNASCVILFFEYFCRIGMDS
jgi:hypothetical protein